MRSCQSESKQARLAASQVEANADVLVVPPGKRELRHCEVWRPRPAGFQAILKSLLHRPPVDGLVEGDLNFLRPRRDDRVRVIRHVGVPDLWGTDQDHLCDRGGNLMQTEFDERADLWADHNGDSLPRALACHVYRTAHDLRGDASIRRDLYPGGLGGSRIGEDELRGEGA